MTPLSCSILIVLIAVSVTNCNGNGEGGDLVTLESNPGEKNGTESSTPSQPQPEANVNPRIDEEAADEDGDDDDRRYGGYEFYPVRRTTIPPPSLLPQVANLIRGISGNSNGNNNNNNGNNQLLTNAAIKFLPRPIGDVFRNYASIEKEKQKQLARATAAPVRPEVSDVAATEVTSVSGRGQKGSLVEEQLQALRELPRAEVRT